MIRPLVVALREVRAYLRDRGDLAFSLLLPIAIFALMYGAFGGGNLFHGTAHIVNEDLGGSYASALVERLREQENLDVELLAPSTAQAKLDRSDLLLVLYIPADFSEKLASGQPAELVFEQRGNGGQEGQIVASIIRGVAGEIDQELQVQSQVRSSLLPRNVPSEQIEITTQRFLEREREHPIVSVKEVIVGSRPDPVSQFLPGVITMFVLFAITLSARAIVEERRKGTLERLLTTRLTATQLFIGKFLANVLRGFVQTVILLVLAYMVFRIFTPLSFAEVLVLALVFSAVAGALGLLIASVARTEDQAVWIASVLTMVMVMLGGTFFKISQGSFLYVLSRLSINTYANDAFSRIIARDGSLADVGREIAVMVGVGGVALLLSRVMFRAVPGGK